MVVMFMAQSLFQMEATGVTVLKMTLNNSFYRKPISQSSNEKR